jgi:hypothetical protein
LGSIENKEEMEIEYEMSEIGLLYRVHAFESMPLKFSHVVERGRAMARETKPLKLIEARNAMFVDGPTIQSRTLDKFPIGITIQESLEPHRPLTSKNEYKRMEKGFTLSEYITQGFTTISHRQFL